MSPFKFDAETGEIPVGGHEAVITEAVPGTNKKGNLNLRIVFATSDGAQIADWLTHLPQTRWRWRQLWEAADLEFPNGGEVDERDLIGKRVHVEVIEDNYQGQARAKVKEVSAPVDLDIPIDFPETETAADAAESFAAAAGMEDDEGAPY